MKFPYVGSDLDGTIVKNKDLRILESTVADILEYQKASDNKFFIVTGRMYEATKYYIHQLQVKIPVISCNGAVITDPLTKEVLFELTIPTEISKKLINFAMQNNLDLIFYSATAMVVLAESERAKVFEKNYGQLEPEFRPNLTELKSYEEMLEQVLANKLKPVKFLFSFKKDGDENEKTLTLKFLQELNLYHPTTIINDRFLVDAMPLGVTKATGIVEWAKIMKVDYKDVHVIGDNHNDIEMVTQSSFGVAVDNAVEKLKQCADVITDHIEENGVGNYLSNLMKG